MKKSKIENEDGAQPTLGHFVTRDWRSRPPPPPPGPGDAKNPRAPFGTRGLLSLRMVEVAGVEPACPWPSRMASTLIVPF